MGMMGGGEVPVESTQSFTKDAKLAQNAAAMSGQAEYGAGRLNPVQQIKMGEIRSKLNSDLASGLQGSMYKLASMPTGGAPGQVPMPMINSMGADALAKMSGTIAQSYANMHTDTNRFYTNMHVNLVNQKKKMDDSQWKAPEQPGALERATPYLMSGVNSMLYAGVGSGTPAPNNATVVNTSVPPVPNMSQQLYSGASTPGSAAMSSGLTGYQPTPAEQFSNIKLPTGGA